VNDRTRVVIATTQGPVDVEAILDLDPGDASTVALGSSAQVLRTLLTPYRDFVARGSGVIARSFGRDAFRLELSGEIHTGESWQLGVYLAHELHSLGHLAEAGEPCERLIWATGRVDYCRRVGAVGHVDEKIRASITRIEAERARGVAVAVVWPKTEETQPDPSLRAELQSHGASVFEADAADGLLPRLDSAFSRHLYDAARTGGTSLFILVDSSESMAGGKIAAVNRALADAFAAMRERDLAGRVWVARFAYGAAWLMQDVPLSQSHWSELRAEGADTDLGLALSLVAETLVRDPLKIAPTILVISDGHATDNLEAGLQALAAAPKGAAARRIAVAIGADADAEGLAQIVGKDGPPVYRWMADDAVEKRLCDVLLELAPGS